MSASKTNKLLNIIAARDVANGRTAPFKNDKDVKAYIDSIDLGHVPWKSFTVKYTDDMPTPTPAWMKKEYDVWYRNPRDVIHGIIGNKDFDGEIDYVPYREFKGGKRQWTDFMSGNWPWNQAVSSFFSSVYSIN